MNSRRLMDFPPGRCRSRVASCNQSPRQLTTTPTLSWTGHKPLHELALPEFGGLTPINLTTSHDKGEGLRLKAKAATVRKKRT